MNFLSKNHTSIFIFFPWKKAAGASLATVTEALAALQIRDTLKSTAHSIGCLFLFIQHQTPSPSSFAADSFQLPDALKSFFSLLSYTDLPRSPFPDQLLLFHSSLLLGKWSLLLALQHHSQCSYLIPAAENPPVMALLACVLITMQNEVCRKK